MTVVIALVANVLVALAKSIAAIVTGSAAMFAEAAHSWADAGNEIFLLVADRSGARRKDAGHPFGYGRDAWVWSLFAAIGIFAVGASVSIYHGITELLDPEPAGDYLVNYVILALSAVLEGFSFLQSVRQARRRARERHVSTLSYVSGSSESTLRAVFLEDGAALLGLAIAALGIGLHQATGIAQFDAVASILIGVLLAVVALFLIQRNRQFLVGGALPLAARAEIVDLLLGLPEVDRVTYLHVEAVGPRRLYLVAAVDLVGDRPEGELARELRRLERRIEEVEVVETAVLTVSAPEEPALPGAAGSAPAGGPTAASAAPDAG